MSFRGRYGTGCDAVKQDLLNTIKRVVIKVGSSVLTGGTDDLNGGVFSNIASCIARLQKSGREVVLVSSGAIAAGKKSLHCVERPTSIPQKQASAAIGQVRLMAKYESCFRKHGQQIAQVLLTSDDLSNRRKFLNARNTLFTLLQCGIIPIINENDSVVVDEIKFGDNDILSALVTNLVDADLLLILTDQDGLYERDPQREKDARLIKLVEKVGSAIYNSAHGGTSRLGRAACGPRLTRQKRRPSLAYRPSLSMGLRAGSSAGFLPVRMWAPAFFPARPFYQVASTGSRLI